MAKKMKDGGHQGDASIPTGGEPCFCSQRWILAVMGLFVGFCMYTVRVNMGIAVVCMVKRPVDSDRNNTSITLSTNASSPFSNMAASNLTGNNSHVIFGQPKDGYNHVFTDDGTKCVQNKAKAEAEYQNAEFTWDKTIQSWILSAYYLGGLFSQIPSGWVASRYGGKHVITFNMAASALCTLLIPVCARFTPYMVIILRTIIGITGCAIIPGWMDMVGKWSPTFERSRMSTTLWTGQVIGTIVTYSTSGILCANGFDNGWGSIFYVHGGLLVLFLLPWLYFTASSPSNHPRITHEERTFIESHMKVSDKTESIPWKAMFTSAPVWSAVIAFAGDTWVFFTILNCLPLFLKEVLKLDIQRNGLFSSLPFVSMAVSLAIGSHLSDCVRARGCLSTLATRRVFQTVSFIGSAACILISGHMQCNQGNIVIMFVCLSTFFTGVGEGGGYVPNVVDYAPRYAGIVMAIANTIGGFSGILTPLVVGVLTKNGTAEEWQRVFYVCLGVAILANIAYLLLSRGEVQPWARNPTDNVEVVINPIETKATPKHRLYSVRAGIQEEEELMHLNANRSGTCDGDNNVSVNSNSLTGEDMDSFA